MGWNGSLTAGSAKGSTITYTPDTTAERTYTTGAFTAPKKGIYRFTLRGSGGSGGGNGRSAGGEGGMTVGYLLMSAGQRVYVGCGGVRACAFVSGVNGASLAAIAKARVHFVAGAGGQGGRYVDDQNNTGYNCSAGAGGDGGGASGGAGAAGGNVGGGRGGSQTGGGTGANAGAYGTGAKDGLSRSEGYYRSYGGGGGDGWYGGGGGYAEASDIGASAGGGGGGSGYVAVATLSVGTATYKSTTARGGGAASNGRGSVQVTYVDPGELPVVFDGTRLEAISYNGVKIGSLIYNGTKLFYRRAAACFTRMARRSLSPAATPACSP